MTEPSPSSTTTPVATPEQVLEFWLGDGIEKDWPTQDLGKRWFGGGAELDAEITARFGGAVDQALAGGLRDWEQPLLHRLALIILLDQFTRNIFRGSARAFSGDARAQQLVRQTIAAGEDAQLPWAARIFLYMPLMHAESPPLQDECVARFTRLVDDAPEALKQRLRGNLDYAHQHRDIIARYGRFPYRNAVLGRADTPEEQEFLHKGPRFGQ
jgi:uncharacterized protein (DUF924 family)